MRGKDISGDSFGELLAIEKTDKRSSSGNIIWLFKCSCGNLVERTKPHSGNACCGCKKYDNIQNKQFSRLRAISRTKKRYHRSSVWRCLCDCGNYIDVPINRLKSGHTKSCGCLHIEKTIERSTGENNHNWNQLLTEKDRETYRSIPEYTKWRNSIYERDDYTCQKCGIRGGDINAHHKDGYHWCKERRTDIDNGITLCKDCHDDFHHEYGNKYNTESQIEEFLNE